MFLALLGLLDIIAGIWLIFGIKHVKIIGVIPKLEINMMVIVYFVM